VNENIKNLLEEIRYSYISLQMNIYFEYYIKVDKNVNQNLDKLLNWIDYDINFDNWKKYLLRKDYIKFWLETSTNKELSWWVL